MSSKEKLLNSSNNLMVTTISPSIPSISYTLDELPEDMKSDYLRRTSSSSSIVTLGLFTLTH